MRSHGKLSYDGVAHALGLTEHGPRQPAAEKRVATLKILLELSQRLRQRRRKRGALDFDLPEGKVVLDDHGEPKAIVQSRAVPGIRQAYRIVEDMMLVTNETVASHIKRHAAPGVFRVHGKPDPERISMFCQVAKSFGYELDEESASTPKQLGRFLRRIEGTDEAPLLRYLLLRAMQQEEQLGGQRMAAAFPVVAGQKRILGHGFPQQGIVEGLGQLVGQRGLANADGPFHGDVARQPTAFEYLARRRGDIYGFGFL